MREEDVIKAAVKALRLPKEIKAVDYLFSDDSTGQPAVWVKLHVAEDNNPSATKVRQLSDLRKAVAKSILSAEVSRWPYVRLVADRA